MTFLAAAAFLLSSVLPSPAQTHAGTPRLPTITANALDGRSVSLPEDLGRLNVVIVGFTRGSADRTTAWEKPVRAELLPKGVQFYDVAVLESLPKFMRGAISSLIRSKVPTVVRPHFLMLYEGDDAWKRAAGFDPRASDAAYVMVVDSDGRVLWSTHEAYSPAEFATLEQELGLRKRR